VTDSPWLISVISVSFSADTTGWTTEMATSL